MTTADIIIGPASIWYAPVGEAEPDQDSIDYGTAWGGNWTNIAMTKTPFSMNRELSTFDVLIEQSTLPVKRVGTEEKVSFETVLAEFTADHLQLAMEGTATTVAAGSGTVGYEQLVAGGQAVLTERQWGVEGIYTDADGVNFPIRMFIYRATAVLNGEVSFGKADSAGIPLQINSLADLTKSVGAQLMKVVKVTAAAEA